LRASLDRPADGANPKPSHSAFRRIVHNGRLLAVHAHYSRSDFGSTGSYVTETFGSTPSYLWALQLKDFPQANGWRDGRHYDQPRLPAGRGRILDLRHDWQAEVTSSFNDIHLNISQTALDELADESGLAQIDINPPSPLLSVKDETLRHLALSLAPAFRRPTELSALFAGHVAAAAAIHLAETYGTAGSTREHIQGGLAPWQFRRVRDLMLTCLDADIDLAMLAAAAGLSPGHFAKAFKRAVGVPPHRWLLRQRVSRAQEMLLKTDEPLTAIALSCGFADQSHLTRVFTKAVGIAPAAWRRLRRS
jgi:AraC family transcriptional regulator